VQADGKVLVAGGFTSLDGQALNDLGRLNADGTLDPGFDSQTVGQESVAFSLAAPSDGEILLGGEFFMFGAQYNVYFDRLNADGTPDSQFDMASVDEPSSPPPAAYSLAMQADGKILLGGSFTAWWGQPCSYLARVNADGSLDTEFSPWADDWVYCLAVQADGKILLGGQFATLNGQPRNCLGRLNADGSLDSQFNAGANTNVYSLALQADGKILVGGQFTTLGGQPRNYFARLNADGTSDTEFRPGADNIVYGLAIQADGKILVGGAFRALDGQTIGCVARLNNLDTATQNLSYDGSSITWLRGGASPEVWATTFEASNDGTNWTRLGAGSRISGGWQLSSVSIPAGATIRARGYYSTGQYNGSSSLLETLLSVSGQAAPSLLLNDGRFGFGTNGFGFNVSGAVGQVMAVECSSNLVNWLPLQTNTLGSSPFYFSDPAARSQPRQFYRARIVP
jgi:uncharacterized delta-60 repeat protein